MTACDDSRTGGKSLVLSTVGVGGFDVAVVPFELLVTGLKRSSGFQANIYPRSTLEILVVESVSV